MSNKVGKMVDGQAGRESPGPADHKYRQHQKSIHPAIHVISSSPANAVTYTHINAHIQSYRRTLTESSFQIQRTPV